MVRRMEGNEDERKFRRFNEKENEGIWEIIRGGEDLSENE